MTTTQTHIDQLIESLRTLRAGAQSAAGELQCFPIYWEGAEPHDYLTLDEALQAGALEITEVTAAGAVPNLFVRNKGALPIFIMAGEELVGAKQNRIINVSIMVPADTGMPIPVTCVEQGRWFYASPTLSSSGHSSHSMLRQMVSEAATMSYKSGTPRSDQGAAWHEIARKMKAMGTVSHSAALNDIYKDLEASLKTIEGGIPAPEGANGVVFVIRGRIVGGDLFDSPRTLTKLWPKMLHSYAIDALEKSTQTEEARNPVSVEAIQAWLRTLEEAKAEQFASPGMGDDVRLTAPHLTGAALLVEGTPVHAELFADRG